MIAILWSLLVAAAGVTRPSSARCPDGWWLAEGVSPRGAFACYLSDSRDRREWPPIEAAPLVVIRSRIYCGVVNPAIVVDAQHVRCK